jgi:LEA14-like dessication related protein
MCLALIIVIGFYGYNSVEFDSSGVNTLVIEFNERTGSLFKSGNMTLGEWLRERDHILKGIRIEGTVDVHNTTFVPLFVPDLEHNLSIDSELIGSTIHTPSFWMAPWGNETVPVSASVPRDQLPGMILRYIYSGGNIDITVESTTKIAGISINKTQTLPFRVTNPIITVLLGSNPASVLTDVGKQEVALFTGLEVMYGYRETGESNALCRYL